MHPIGAWQAGAESPAFGQQELLAASHRVREPVFIVRDPRSGRMGVGIGGQTAASPTTGAWPLTASLPALYPEWLGDRSFTELHGVRFPYVSGAMANGIATTELVVNQSCTKNGECVRCAFEACCQSSPPPPLPPMPSICLVVAMVRA